MPLKRGSSKEIISKNIQMLIREGKPYRQAVAIALSESEVRKKKTSRKKRKKV